LKQEQELNFNSKKTLIGDQSQGSRIALKTETETITENQFKSKTEKLSGFCMGSKPLSTGPMVKPR